MKNLAVKRIYEEALEGDGYRILVDRIWPRGVSKENAKLSEWLKEIAPSNELRKWYEHEPQKNKKFIELYKEELRGKTTELEHLVELVKKQKVTLLYAAKIEELSQIPVIVGIIKRKIDLK